MTVEIGANSWIEITETSCLISSMERPIEVIGWQIYKSLFKNRSRLSALNHCQERGKNESETEKQMKREK